MELDLHLHIRERVISHDDIRQSEDAGDVGIMGHALVVTEQQDFPLLEEREIKVQATGVLSPGMYLVQGRPVFEQASGIIVAKKYVWIGTEDSQRYSEIISAFNVKL